jgi:hypothetical protein
MSETKTYNVRIENLDIPYQLPSIESFDAKNAQDAIKQAREFMRRKVGHTKRDGRLSYKIEK